MIKKFEIKKNFEVNGVPTKIISGSIHYFRVLPSYWEDRIIKLKELGCNSIETYVPWNLHEPHEGEFNFSGIANIEKFLSICKKHNLLVILRLSPYICAEWEFGGLPGWLLKYDAIKIRFNNELFLSKVENYYKNIIPKIKNHLFTNGGNIIMMQIENEYGSFSYDKEYLKKIKNIMIKYGIDVPLFTSDGPWDNLLLQGSCNNLALPTGNFGSNAKARFKFLKDFIGEKPLMCMEFWDGWFDCWGDDKHHIRDPKETAKSLDEVLEHGSVNLYMFHGGTNFGFWNGSNFKDKLLSRVTSYDYDAPLSESGEYREKFFKFKDVIEKHTGVKTGIADVVNNKLRENFVVSNKVGLLSNIENISRKKVTLPHASNMEAIDQNYGYIVYKTNYDSAYKFNGKLKLHNANDRAHIFINKKLVKIVENHEISLPIDVKINNGKNEVLIIIENLGRVNYGPKMVSQKKGIVDGVEIDKILLSNWEHFVVDFENINDINFNKLSNDSEYVSEPMLNIFNFKLKTIADTFINCEKYNKGQIFVNNFNLGRYWKIGPQKNLYLPKGLLKKENEIIILETDDAKIKNLEFFTMESL